MFADLKMIRTFAPLSTESTSDKGSFGEVAEWSIAAVLKTVVLRGTRGSNPCLSAENSSFEAAISFVGNIFPLSVFY